MKNFLHILLVCLVFLTACGDDEVSVVGTYKLTSMSQTNCNDSDENFELDFGSDDCATTGGIEFCESGLYTFSADGNFRSTVILSSAIIGEVADLSGSGTYELVGNDLSICIPECEDFIFNGNNITFTDTSDGCVVTVILSKT